MKKEELTEILRLHSLYLAEEENGVRANLRGADLRLVNLRGADLRDALVFKTNFRGADLRDANLRDANLAPIKQDLYAILSEHPQEVPGVLAALKQGRINGSVYEGECACLVGTIAKLAGRDYREFSPDSSRPAEVWFLAIREGDTPENSPICQITTEWIEEWAPWSL